MKTVAEMGWQSITNGRLMKRTGTVQSSCGIPAAIWRNPGFGAENQTRADRYSAKSGESFRTARALSFGRGGKGYQVYRHFNLPRLRSSASTSLSVDRGSLFRDSLTVPSSRYSASIENGGDRLIGVVISAGLDRQIESENPRRLRARPCIWLRASTALAQRPFQRWMHRRQS